MGGHRRPARATAEVQARGITRGMADYAAKLQSSSLSDRVGANVKQKAAGSLCRPGSNCPGSRKAGHKEPTAQSEEYIPTPILSKIVKSRRCSRTATDLLQAITPYPRRRPACKERPRRRWLSRPKKWEGRQPVLASSNFPWRNRFRHSKQGLELVTQCFPAVADAKA